MSLDLKTIHARQYVHELELPLGITPGEYPIYAFPAGAEVDRRDPDALKPFEKYGEAMKFAEGERKLVNLKAAQIE